VKLVLQDVTKGTSAQIDRVDRPERREVDIDQAHYATRLVMVDPEGKGVLCVLAARPPEAD
jgi:hypothetical protein